MNAISFAENRSGERSASIVSSRPPTPLASRAARIPGVSRVCRNRSVIRPPVAILAPNDFGGERGVHIGACYPFRNRLADRRIGNRPLKFRKALGPPRRHVRAALGRGERQP